MSLAFVKMQGLGNDFVIVDRRAAGTPLPASEAVALCDRHRGIGADGVLSILPSSSAPITMHVTNADGSIAEMCGNGLRCVVRYAVDRHLIGASGGPIETGRGVLDCSIEPDGQVRVDMGAPVLQPRSIPMSYDGPKAVRVPLEVGGRRLLVTAVSMGNPHAVVFLEKGQNPRDWAERMGPALERHPDFPNRTNAEFALPLSPTEIDLVVWERGSGLTQACGTGACATVVAAVLTEQTSPGAVVKVNLPGGPLRVQVEPDLSRVWMTGPAVEVFSGMM